MLLQTTLVMILRSQKHHTHRQLYTNTQKHSTMSNKHTFIYCALTHMYILHRNIYVCIYIYMHTYVHMLTFIYIHIVINNVISYTSYKTPLLMTWHNCCSVPTAVVIVTKWNDASNDTSSTTRTATQRFNSLTAANDYKTATHKPALSQLSKVTVPSMDSERHMRHNRVICNY